MKMNYNCAHHGWTYLVKEFIHKGVYIYNSMYVNFRREAKLNYSVYRNILRCQNSKEKQGNKIPKEKSVAPWRGDVADVRYNILFCKLGSEYGGISFTISLRCTRAFYIFLYIWYTLQKQTNPQNQRIHYFESFDSKLLTEILE